MWVATGQYVGDGADARAIVGVGFTPKAVLIKAQATQAEVWRFDTMVGDLSMPGGAVAWAADHIESLDSDGFTIGTNARVNGSATIYLWTAWGGDGVECVTYVGNAPTTVAVTGVGFQPDLVLTTRNGAAAMNLKTAAMPSVGSMVFNAGAFDTVSIDSLDADGFTVGNDTGCNNSGSTYHALCMQAEAGVFEEFAYTGDATVRTLTGAGFKPDMAIVKRSTGAVNPFMRHLSHVGAVSNYLQTALNTVTTAITGLTADGFSVANDANVNGSTIVYYAVMFRQNYPLINTGQHIVANAGTLVTSLALPSWTPETGSLVLVYLTNRTGGTTVVSVAGNGLTFEEIASLADNQNQHRGSLWGAIATSPTTGQITVTISAAKHISAQAITIPDADTSGTVDDAVEAVATADTGATDTTAVSVAVTTLTDGARVYGFISNRQMATDLTIGPGETPVLLNHESGWDSSSGESVQSSVVFQNKAVAGAVTIDGTLGTAREWTAIAVSIKPGTSGTTFNETLTGTLTSAGAVIQRPGKLAVGALASSGALSRRTAQLLTAALTPAGTLLNRTIRALAGTLTSSGDLISSRVALLMAAGSLATAGALTRHVNRLLAGALSTSGALSRSTARLLTGAFTPTGALLTVRTRLLSVVGTLTTAGSLSRQTQRILSGALSSGGSLVKRTARLLAGTLTSSATLTAVRQATTFPITLVGTLATSGALLRQTRRMLTGALVTAGSLSNRTARLLGGTLASSGVVTTVRARVTALAGTLASSGALRRQPGKQTGGALATSGDVTRSASRLLDGGLGLAGSLGRGIARTLGGLLATAGELLASLGEPAAPPVTELLGSETLVVVLTGSETATIALVGNDAAIELVGSVDA